MQIALDQNNNRIFIKDFKKTQDEAICPCCKEKLVPRQGNVNAWCFAHKPESNCMYRDDSNDMSPWHIGWQSLFPLETREVFKRNADNEIRRADVLMEDKKIEIEFQHSPITEDEISARNEFWNDLGYTTIWVFDTTESNFDFHSDNFFSRYYYPNRAITKDETIDNENNLVFLETKNRGIILITGCKNDNLSNFVYKNKFATKEKFISFLLNDVDENFMSEINKTKDETKKEILTQIIKEKISTLSPSKFVEYDYDCDEAELNSIPFYFCEDRNLKSAIFTEWKALEPNEDVDYIVFRQDVTFVDGKWRVWGFLRDCFEREIIYYGPIGYATRQKWEIDQTNIEKDFFLKESDNTIINKKIDEYELQNSKDDCLASEIQTDEDEEKYKDILEEVFDFEDEDDDEDDDKDEEDDTKENEYHSILYYFDNDKTLNAGIFRNVNTGMTFQVSRYNYDMVNKYNQLYGIQILANNKKGNSISIYFYYEDKWEMIWEGHGRS